MQYHIWRRLRYLLLFSIFLLLVLLIYRFSIPRSLIGGRVMVVFALLAALAMAVCSAVFSVFLSLSSRYDVTQFVEKARDASTLSSLTGGLHLHNLRCPSQEAYDRVCADLKKLGILYTQG